MADYLLDTNHAAALVTLTHPVRSRVLLRLQAGNAFAIAVPRLLDNLNNKVGRAFGYIAKLLGKRFHNGG